MAMDPLHRIRGAERQCAREYLVERDTERVEVAAGIDGAVHPSGLFGRHVGERPRNRLGGIGPVPLGGAAAPAPWGGRREARPNPLSQHWPVSEFTRTLAGLMSLWMTPR